MLARVGWGSQTTYSATDDLSEKQYRSLMQHKGQFDFGEVLRHLDSPRTALCNDKRRARFIKYVTAYLFEDLSTLQNAHFPLLCSIIEKKMASGLERDLAYTNVADLALSIGMFTIAREIASFMTEYERQRELLDRVIHLEKSQAAAFFALVDEVLFAVQINGSPISGAKETLAAITRYRGERLTRDLCRDYYEEIAAQKDFLRNATVAVQELCRCPMDYDGEERYKALLEKLNRGAFYIREIATMKETWQKGEIVDKLEAVFQAIELPDTLTLEMGVIKRAADKWKAQKATALSILSALEEACKNYRQNGDRIKELIAQLQNYAPNSALYNQFVQNAVPIIAFLKLRSLHYEALNEKYNALRNTLRQQFFTLEDATPKQKETQL